VYFSLKANYCTVRSPVKNGPLFLSKRKISNGQERLVVFIGTLMFFMLLLRLCNGRRDFCLSSSNRKPGDFAVAEEEGIGEVMKKQKE